MGQETSTSEESFELRFTSLFHSGRALSFPCSAQGEVDEAGLSAKALNNYRWANRFVGKEVATPHVHRLCRINPAEQSLKCF